MATNLSSPGVEVIERDESLRLTSQTGTTVFVPGFASQGPIDEINPISTIEDFEVIYGAPTNEAERYFYYAVKALLDNAGNSVNVLVSRLPYGDGEGDSVSTAFDLLAYPAIPVAATSQMSSDKNYGFDTYQTASKDIIKTKLSIKNSVTKKAYTLESFENLSAVSPSRNTNKIGFTIADLTVTGLSILTGAKDVSAKTYGEKGGTASQVGTDFATVSGKAIIENIPNEAGKAKISIAIPIKHGKDVVGISNIIMVISGIEGSLDTITIDIAPSSGGTDLIDFSLVDAYVCDKSPVPNSDGHLDYYGDSMVEHRADYNYNMTYLVGRPVSYHISLEQYYQLVNGEMFDWSRDPNTFEKLSFDEHGRPSSSNDEGTTFGLFDAIKNSAFIAINIGRTIVNDSYEGYYFGLTDNMFNEADSNKTYNAIKDVKITNYDDSSVESDSLNDVIGYEGEKDYLTLHSSRLDFRCASSNSGSLSRFIQDSINSFDISGEDYDDTLNFAIFKLKKTAVANEVLKLTYSIVGAYNASLGKSRQKTNANASKPVTYFIENVLEGDNNLQILVNPNIARFIQIDNEGNLHGKFRVYSDKLVENMKYFEKAYLGNSISSTTVSGKNSSSLMTPIQLAQNNVKTFNELCRRCGVTPSLLAKEGLYYSEDERVATEKYAGFRHSNSIYPFGVYNDVKSDNKIIGTVPAKLSRALSLVENDEEYDSLNVVLDGGLSTIYAYSNTKDVVSEVESTTITEAGDDSSNLKVFDPSVVLQGIEDLRTGKSSLTLEAEAVIEDYMAVQNTFLQFANSTTNGGRGDVFYVADVLRGILVKGRDTKIERLYNSVITNNAYGDGDSNIVKHSWSTSVYCPLKHLTNGFTSSYAASYAQFLKVLDNFSGEKIWLPSSAYVVANMCATDALHGPWYAPAGLNRGLVGGVLDTAINPNQKQRGDLYKICINSIPKIAGVGVTIWGIRTMSKKASAFDQITCRRTFLYIEQAVKRLLKYYVFEPNLAHTRLNVYNDIDPFLERVQNEGGVYSYQLVCDLTNNTEEVINNGEMAVDITAQPTRTAEFIVLTMTANRYTQSVSSSEYNA